MMTINKQYKKIDELNIEKQLLESKKQTIKKAIDNIEEQQYSIETAKPNSLLAKILYFLSFGKYDLFAKYKNKKHHLKKAQALQNAQLNDNNEALNNIYSEVIHASDELEILVKNWKDELNILLKRILKDSSSRFVQHKRLKKYSELLNDLAKQNIKFNPDIDLNNDYLRLLYKEPLEWRQKSNDTFVQKESELYKEQLGKLTPSQKKAAVSNEQNNLILAGAGSGKTYVVVSRVAYLLKKKLATADEILVLVFNGSAAKEIKERLHKLNINVKVSTFHSFGYSAYKKYIGVKRTPCPFTDTKQDKLAFTKHLQNIFTNLLMSSSIFYQKFSIYFLEHFTPYKNVFEFETKDEYLDYIRTQELRTLQGNIVKSYEELMISNYLTLNGIKHEYERNYEHNTATETKRQYQPDFYLSDYNIYLEHFGIDKNGNTAPYIDAKKYNEDIKWKVNLHMEKGTTLIQTFSYERMDGTLLEKLEEKLKDHGVKIEPISYDTALKIFNEIHVIDNFTSLVESFLNHYKSNNLTIQDLYSRIGNTQNREKAFIDVFDIFINAYEEFKIEHACIDFHDMILKACDAIKSNQLHYKFKYIIIDEFQDISIARNNLAILTRQLVKDSIVTVVGDDWQAINQFAGSDVGIIKNYEKYYGDTETIMLDNTFRFDNNISKIATHFITKNKTQLKKEIIPTKQVNEPSVFIYWYGYRDDYISNVVEQITKLKNYSKEKSLMLLGRNKHAFPKNINDIINKYKPYFANISKLTAHRSKGLESDYVIICGIKAGIVGFPTEITDDPLLNIVLTSPEDIEFAEERRLFYVALTRVKEQLFLAVDKDEPSVFIKELLDDFPNDIIDLNERESSSIQCPKCSVGILKKINGQNGDFFACSRYHCNYTLPNNYLCPECGEGILEKKNNYYMCSKEECVGKIEACPQCGEMIVKRNSKYGDFLGCSGYKKNNCGYTKKI